MTLPLDTVIGYDRESDERNYHVSEGGIVVVEGGRTPVDIARVRL